MQLVDLTNKESNAPLNRFGEEMFGRPIRLRTFLWASSQTEEFNQSDAARGINYSSTGEVAKELERLVNLEMLRKHVRAAVGPQNYTRVSHPAWLVIHSMLAVLSGEIVDLLQIPMLAQSTTVPMEQSLRWANPDANLLPGEG